jgi:hypothetical protein
MLKFITLLLTFLLFSSFYCFSQEKSSPIIINKKVEVVDYDYEYVFIELISSLHYSLYYPVITFGSKTENQQFFEKGRNVRPGFEIGFTQYVKSGRWAVKAGISFLQYNELFSYNEYLTRQLTIQNQDGSFQSITVATGEPVLYSRNNRLGYLKIPIGVGFYPTLFKNKLGLNLQFNYHYLLLADYKTKYSITQPAGFVSLEYFNSSFLSITGSMLIQFKLIKNLSVTFEPYFDFNLNNLIDQKDLTFGIHEIGLHTGFMLQY